MKLSIILHKPTDLPSKEEIQQIFTYTEEMGLGNFGDIRVDYSNNRTWIIFEASYRCVFTDDNSSNVCLLMIVLERNRKTLQGRFKIWDPVAEKNIAYAGLLPYSQFVPFIKRVQEIGTLAQDIRAKWYEFKGWKDLLPAVRHG